MKDHPPAPGDDLETADDQERSAQRGKIRPG